MSALLELKNFSVERGGVVVLRDISLSVAPGEAVAVLGDNGAGKSSLLAGIVGLADSSGGLRFDGHEIGRWPVHRRACLGLGYCPDHRGMFPGLSARETLAASCRSAPRRGQQVEQALALFPELKRRADAPSWQLSGGEQQMLALLRTLIGRPKLLLLDEPALGLAPALRLRLTEVLVQAQAAGAALLLADRDEELTRTICSRTIFLECGNLV
jgi:branched-chain amino acid transport system ATP-binding protein